MSVSSGVPVSSQAKGAVFEKVVRKLLEKNESEKCAPDNEQVDDCGRVRGRGARATTTAVNTTRAKIRKMKLGNIIQTIRYQRYNQQTLKLARVS